MPMRCLDYQKRFTWEITPDGAPLADVILLGAGIPYTAACPLCGCLHELPLSTQDGQVITPRCLLKEFGSQGTSHWTVMYGAWMEAHPEAAAHTAIAVRMTTIEALNARPALKVVKPKAARTTAKPRARRKAKAPDQEAIAA